MNFNLKQSNKQSLLHLLDIYIVPIVLFIVIAFGVTYLVYASIPKPVQHRADADQNPIITVEGVLNHFDSINIEAGSAMVYDMKEGKILFEKNAYVKRPLASITKLMTALTAVDSLGEDYEITIDSNNLINPAYSKLSAGEVWSFKDLLEFSLIVSSNDGAKSIAAAIGPNFVESMNTKARQVGLQNSVFLNETGLDIDTYNGGAYGSARDVILLTEYIVNNNQEILEATKYENLDFVSKDKTVHEASNTNKIIGKLPNVIGSKTGYTDLSGGNLVVVFDADLGRPIIIVVLGSSFEGRFNDVELLSKTTLKALSEMDTDDTISE